MGWTFTHKDKSESVKEFFEKEFNYTNENGSCKILDIASNFHETYIAMERTNPDGTRYVFGVVCLLRHVPRDYYNFGYKDMDESMGPNVSNCPERILRLLSDYPHMNDWAKDWRQRCRAKIEARKARPRLSPGMVIEFDEDIHFTNGWTMKRFKVLRTNPLRFTTDGSYCGQIFRMHRRTLKKSFRVIAAV